MYKKLKTIIKTILPNSIFYQYESFFREVVYWFYKGRKFQCNICGAHLKTFLQLENKDLLCPRCGSLPRTRRLYELLSQHNCLKGKILHFSPPFSLYKILSQFTGIQYVSSDFDNEFIAIHQYDLTNIPVADNTFDFFIAYHVLEHIEADQQAMSELYRVIKRGGKGLIQTPFKTGEIYEDFSIQSPKERLQYFGQKDHVRIYSADGLQARLTAADFKVEQLVFKEKLDNYHGFKMEEIVLMVTK